MALRAVRRFVSSHAPLLPDLGNIEIKVHAYGGMHMPLRALANIKPAYIGRPGAVRLSVFDINTSQDIRLGLNAALKGSTSIPVIAKAYFDTRIGELIVAPTNKKSMAKLQHDALYLMSRGVDPLGMESNSELQADVKERPQNGTWEGSHQGLPSPLRRKQGKSKKTSLHKLKVEKMLNEVEEDRTRRRIERSATKRNKALRQIIRLETAQEFDSLGKYSI